MKHPRIYSATNYALALAFFFFTNLAASRVLFSLYALHLGASAFEAGLVLGVFYLFPVLLSWPVGVLSDRFGSRWLLIVAACIAVVALLIPYFFSSMAAVYVASVLGGLSLSLYNVILQALVGVLSAPGERTRAFANLSLAGSISNAIGPALAGYSMDQSGPAFACLVIAAFPAIAGVLVVAGSRLLPSGGGSSGPRRRMLDALAQKGVWRMLMMSALVQLAMDLHQFFIPVYGHAIGLSNSAIGLAISAFSVAMFMVRIMLPRLAAMLTEIKVLELSFYVAAVGYLLVPLTDTALGLSVLSFFMGLGIGGAAPLTMVLMFAGAKEGRSAEGLGLRLTTNNVVRVFGPSLFGLLASGAGLVVVFVVVAVVMVGGGYVSRAPGRST